MSRAFVVAGRIALFLLIGVFCGCQMYGTNGGLVKGSGYTSGTMAGVSISQYTFNPTPLSFPQAAGVTVTWTNNQGGITHTVTSDTGLFDSMDVAPGATFTFNASALAPGSYGYHCNIHPSMTGTITITP